MATSATHPRMFRRFQPSAPIKPSELDPFGITESEKTAKVGADSVRNYNQFMVKKPKQPWIARLTETPCPFFRSGSSLREMEIIRQELEANPDIVGEPLREVDPHYMGHDTYVTVTHDMNLHRFCCLRSVGLFPPESEVRKTAISVVCSEYFQAFIILLILLDFLALVASGERDFVVEFSSDLFFAIYFAEMTMKMIAYGLVLDPFSYLRFFESYIELVVLISGVVPLLVPDATMLNQLRVIRVVRLFRVIATLKFTRKIIEALAKSLRDLVPVFVLFFVIVSFVSLISLVFFNGLLLGKCVKDPSGVAGSIGSADEYKKWRDNSTQWYLGPMGPKRCPVIGRDTNLMGRLLDDRELRRCPRSYSCRLTASGNPDLGFTNFDTLMLSMLSTFRLLCQDWWDNLYILLSFVNGSYTTTLFFLFIIFFGSHYIINLMLSTITLAYQRNELSPIDDASERARLGVAIEVNRNGQLYRQVEVYNLLCHQGHQGVAEPLFLEKLAENPVSESSEVRTLLNDFTKNYQLTTDADSETGAGQLGFFGKMSRLLRCMVMRPGVESLPIDAVANSIVLMNILEMMLSAPPDEELRLLGETTNLLYTTIFAIEALLKMHYQKMQYFHRVANRIDFFIVVLCLIELLLPGRDSKILVLLRMTRLLRLLKLARISTELEKLITVAIRSFASVMSLIVLSFTIIVISAGIGMVLFQEAYERQSKYLRPMQNFVDFYNSVLVVFRIMCGEWVENLWVCMQLVSTTVKRSYCVTYFLVNQIIVSLIIFQLFIGILLNKFSEYRAEVQDVDETVKMTSWKMRLKKLWFVRLVKRARSCKQSSDSLGYRIRKPIEGIVSDSSSNFSYFIIIMTILSSVALVFDDYYLKDDKKLVEICSHLEIIFLNVFAVEMLLKIVAFGPLGYASSGWRLLDGVIVLISLVDVVVTYTLDPNLVNIGVFRVFRTLRCLRILRTANVWEGFKLTINALFRSVRKLIFAFLIVMLVWLMFALVSTSLFSMRLHRCEDASGSVLDRSVVANKSHCEQLNHTWSGRLINFDTTPAAMLALLEIAVFKGWIGIFQDLSNVPDHMDEQPFPNRNSSFYLLIYIAFIIIGSFFLLGMLIGVIVDSFEEERKHLANEVVTEGQRKLQNSLLHFLMFPVSPKKPPPESAIGAFFHKLNGLVYVELFYLLLILASTLVMALQYHPGQNQLNKIYLPLADDIILFFFGIELVTRILGDEAHFLQPLLGWNLVDFLIVLLSLSGKVSNESVDLQYLRIVRFARVFRMGRLLAKSANIKAVRNILLTIVITLPSMLNIISLQLMAICIFSIVGVSLFSDQSLNMEHPFNEMFNFRSFVSTWRMLFIVTTSAGFNDYLHASMKFDGVFRSLGIAYWVTFLCLSFFVLTNLMVSAVVSSYNDVFDDEASMVRLDTAEMLMNVWSDFDRAGTGFLPVSTLPDLLDALPEPLRVPKPNSGIISMMQVPLTDDLTVCYKDVVRALVKEIMKRTGDMDFEEKRRRVEPGSDRPLLDTKLYGKLQSASNYVKYCWWRRQVRLSRQRG